MHKIIRLLLCWGVISAFHLNAQTTFVLGTNDANNTNISYPAPYGNWFWGAKHQILIRADELMSQGINAGNITSLAFDVVDPKGVTIRNLRIKMALTSDTNLTQGFVAAPFTTVYSSSTHTVTQGWNTHTFSVPFYWDGIQNIVIETCFNNISFTQNPVFNLTNTAYTSCAYIFGDNTSVCGMSNSTKGTQRPVMQLTIVPVLPVADFTLTYQGCSDTIDFIDQTSGTPLSWLWDFGDGNTSTQQNPAHYYSTPGSYTVSLIACNTSGCDTSIKTNYVNINATSLPVAAGCFPATINGSLNFGITSVTLHTLSNLSGDASAGYEDFTCLSTNLTTGKNYTLSVVHDYPALHNCAAWIDWNNDGVFDDVTERILTSSASYNSSTSFSVPPSAVTNTPLRLRIIADYYLSAAPTPCANPDFGQAEDYTVIVLPNNNPPDVAFTANKTITCNGVVSFTDLSENLPTYWFWDFGDGNTSFVQHPTHTYTSDGTYTVSLICTNANGTGGDTITNYITVSLGAEPVPPSCTPPTLSYCCGYGIYQVKISTPYGYLSDELLNISDNASEGYRDFSCNHQIKLYKGKLYPISIKTGFNNIEDVRVWIDFNNDGDFSANELVLDKQGTHHATGYLYIPLYNDSVVLQTPLRLRVRSDVVGAPKTACDAPLYGQIEDYAVIIDTLPDLPVAGFYADKNYVCNDSVYFFNQSSANSEVFVWNFGDGDTSSAANPVHIYTAPGIYNVSLTAYNPAGSSAEIKYHYIEVNCDTFFVPDSGVTSVNYCYGLVSDDGQVNNYSNSTDGVFVIQPSGGNVVQLQFLTFQFEPGDTLFVYDGTINSQNLLGAYSGFSLPPAVSAYSGTLILKQKTDAQSTQSGFLAEWSCATAIENKEDTGNPIRVYPNPVTGNVFYIKSHQPIEKVELMSILGQHLQTFYPENNTIILPENITNASYIVQIFTETTVYHSQIIINK